MEKAIWAIEEKAIIFFKSVKNKQVTPTKNIPKRLIKINQLVDFKSLRNVVKRKIPIPPSFKRIPARIIEP